MAKKLFEIVYTAQGGDVNIVLVAAVDVREAIAAIDANSPSIPPVAINEARVKASIDLDAEVQAIQKGK